MKKGDYYVAKKCVSYKHAFHENWKDLLPPNIISKFSELKL